MVLVKVEIEYLELMKLLFGFAISEDQNQLQLSETVGIFDWDEQAPLKRYSSDEHIENDLILYFTYSLSKRIAVSINKESEAEFDLLQKIAILISEETNLYFADSFFVTFVEMLSVDKIDWMKGKIHPKFFEILRFGSHEWSIESYLVCKFIEDYESA
jgi:hypothetical protein